MQLPVSSNSFKLKILDIIFERHNSIIIFDEKKEYYNKRYIYGYHPHGNLPIGIACCKNNDNFRNTLLAVSWQALYVPCYKIFYYFAGGIITVSKKSLLENIKKTDKNIMLVPGGIKEMLYNNNENICLNTKNKGFIKIAINEGLDLIPIFCFGENDLYINITKSIEKFTYKYFKILIPSILVNKKYLPTSEKEVKLTYIIGKPIQVNKNINASQEEINKLHTLYYNSIMDIYNKYKVRLNEKRDLIFVTE